MQPTAAPSAADPSAIGTSSQPAGPSPTATSQPPQYDRPPPGLAQGEVAAPPWLIGALGGVIVLGVIAFFVARHRRAKRSQIYESIAPKSSRR
ncbi:MAG: hypothetical protein JRI68_03600 [Deltaproteobacteria bacterium]|nr:hypothetical protein [Deltaproteobacteria bacterium]